MKQIPCDELTLRTQSGKLICSDIAGFSLGDEQVNGIGTFRDVVISVNLPKLTKVGNRIVVWNTAKGRKALTFTVTGTAPDPVRQTCQIEGRVYVRPG